MAKRKLFRCNSRDILPIETSWVIPKPFLKQSSMPKRFSNCWPQCSWSKQALFFWRVVTRIPRTLLVKKLPCQLLLQLVDPAQGIPKHQKVLDIHGYNQECSIFKTVVDAVQTATALRHVSGFRFCWPVSVCTTHSSSCRRFSDIWIRRNPSGCCM